MKKTKNKPPPQLLLLADGREGIRRFATHYWFDGRMKHPSPFARGFPQAEDGSTRGASQTIMTGIAFKVKCYDRVKGKYIWSITRGDRVPGTHVYQPMITAGDVDG